MGRPLKPKTPLHEASSLSIRLGRQPQLQGPPHMLCIRQRFQASLSQPDKRGWLAARRSPSLLASGHPSASSPSSGACGVLGRVRDRKENRLVCPH